MGLFSRLTKRHEQHEQEKCPDVTELFCKNGRIDLSEINADNRPKEKRKASGYDPYDCICKQMLSFEPKRLYEPDVFDDDGYIQDIHFVFKDLPNVFEGDKLFEIDADPLELGDTITWYRFCPKGYLGYSNGEIAVKYDQSRKEGPYKIIIQSLHPYLIYGTEYIVDGFETQAEVMRFLRKLRTQQMQAYDIHEKRTAEDRKARFDALP